CIQAIEYPLTF
nr:immunoglobulin light chain junction region [Macaca mulatta]